HRVTRTLWERLQSGLPALLHPRLNTLPRQRAIGRGRSPRPVPAMPTQVRAQRHRVVVCLLVRAEQQRVAALRDQRLAQGGDTLRIGIEFGEVALAEPVPLLRVVVEPLA